MELARGGEPSTPPPTRGLPRAGLHRHRHRRHGVTQGGAPSTPPSTWISIRRVAICNSRAQGGATSTLPSSRSLPKAGHHLHLRQHGVPPRRGAVYLRQHEAWLGGDPFSPLSTQISVKMGHLLRRYQCGASSKVEHILHHRPHGARIKSGAIYMSSDPARGRRTFCTVADTELA